MKYNININQYAAIKLGLDDKLDIVDLSIFSMLYQFGNMPACVKMHEDGQHWCRFKHGLIQKELPILKLTTRQAIHKRMQKLVSCGLLECHADNQKNRDSFYKFTELAGKLWFTDVNENEHSVKDGLHTSVNGSSHTSVKDGLHDNNTSSYNNTNLYNNKEEGEKFPTTPLEDNSDKVLLTPPKRKRKAKIDFKFPTSFTPDVIKAVESYMQMRKDIGKAIKSQQSFSILCNDCEMILTNYGKETLLYSIECSISAEWQRVYLKQPQGSNGKPQGNLKQPIQITDREMHDKVLTLECTLKNLRIYTNNLDGLKDQAKLDAMQDIYNTHKNKSK